MIQNIIDNRKHQHRWKRINAVVEPTWHDNKALDADHAEPESGESDYDERTGISLAEAIAWAQALPYSVTIHFYDEDSAAH